MTLQEWKDQMAERFTGKFMRTGGSTTEIRHKTLEDVDGEGCCPIIALEFESNTESHDASNSRAEMVGIGLGLDPKDVEMILDASDYLSGELTTTGSRDSRYLRYWMLAVLCDIECWQSWLTHKKTLLI